MKQLADTWDQSDKEQVKKKEKPGHTKEANKQNQLYKTADSMARVCSSRFYTQGTGETHQQSGENRGKLNQVQD